MKRSATALLAIVFIIASVSIPVALPEENILSARLSEQKKHIKWLLGIYGELTPADSPYVTRVHDIFDRVRAVADKRANRPPELIIIREADYPWTMCLEDGTIVLTQKCMEVCYQGVDRATGDARMAFVLGHELAHLAKDDFWQWRAFEAVQRLGSDPKTVKELLELIRKTEDVEDTEHAREIRKKKEIQADGYGLLYASMAGYDPEAVLNQEGNNFFREWVNRITGKAVSTDELHPGSEHRAVFLLSTMKAIRNDLDLFYIGVRLYQLGKYKEALDFMETFQRKFPCREVSGNIGLIHYQMGIKALAEYDRDKAYRFKLATVLDTETRARKFVKRGAEPKDMFNREIQKSIRHFEAACKKDAFYIPARVNLSSALIMAGNYHGAMEVLKEASKLQKGDPKALNNQAVAMYLLGPGMNVDMSGQAIVLLTDVTKKNPDFPNAFYNMANILVEHGRESEARPIWEKYLSLESIGVYAETAGKVLGIKSAKPSSHALSESSPVRLGDFDQAKEQLAGFKMLPLELKRTSGKFFSKKGVRVLVLEDVVKVVERPVTHGKELSALDSIYGKPHRILEGLAGTRTFVYDKFAFDVKDDLVARVIYF